VDSLDNKLKYIVWVENTDYYVASKDDDWIMKGQILVSSPTAGLIDFGSNVENSGFLNTGSLKFPIFYGNQDIKLIDHTSMTVQTTHNIGDDALKVDGIPNTNKVFLAIKDGQNVDIADYITWAFSQTIPIVDSGSIKIMHLSIIKFTNKIVVYYDRDGDNKIAIIDHTQAPGSEQLSTEVYSGSEKPIGIKGLNASDRFLVADDDKYFGIYEPSNTIWKHGLFSDKVEAMDASLDDNFIIYRYSDDKIVILRRDAPAPTCDYSIEVAKGGSCQNCSDLTQFNSR
jgi:hypothetical protein